MSNTASTIDFPSDIETALPARFNYDYPQEKRNPRNWNFLCRIFHTIIPGLLAFQITFSTSIMIPALAHIMFQFNVNRTVALLTLTLYTIGLAFGPLITAPLSEVFGRRYVYIGSSACLLLFTGLCTVVDSFAALLVLRFLAGFFGSAPLAVGAGTIGDVWGLGKAGAYAGLLFILGPFLGPSLGPLAGGYIMASHDSWHWTLYTCLMVGTPIFVSTIIMQETSRDWILRKDPGFELDITADKLGGVLRKALVKPIMMLFTDSVVSVLALYTAYAYALVFSFFASLSYIMQLYYDFNVKEVGLCFISVIIGYLIATAMFGIFTAYAERKAKAAGTPVTTEMRLLGACAGSFLLPAGLFWYAWEAHAGGRWAALFASSIIFGWGAFSIFLSIIIYQVDFFGAESGASALAANGILRYIMGAPFPLFIIQMYQDLGIHWASSTFSFLAFSMIPIPFVLFKYGPYLREHSKFIPKSR